MKKATEGYRRLLLNLTINDIIECFNEDPTAARSEPDAMLSGKVYSKNGSGGSSAVDESGVEAES